jgi:hypothetical protein
LPNLTQMRGAPTKKGGAERRPLFHPCLQARAVARLPVPRQFITKVLMRLGTSPTGMTALIVMLAVSMAVTERRPELEM